MPCIVKQKDRLCERLSSKLLLPILLIFESNSNRNILKMQLHRLCVLNFLGYVLAVLKLSEKKFVVHVTSKDNLFTLKTSPRSTHDLQNRKLILWICWTGFWIIPFWESLDKLRYTNFVLIQFYCIILSCSEWSLYLSSVLYDKFAI